MSNYVLYRENKTYKAGSRGTTIALAHSIKLVLERFTNTVISLGEIKSEAFAKKEKWNYWVW